MFKRKLVFAYGCLVVVPLLGVLGILRLGQHLTPPVSVGGNWNLDADFSALALEPCRELLSSVSQPFLSISQSGINLVFSLNNPQKTTLSGTIRDTALTMGAERSGNPESATGNCRDPQAIYLKATVNKQGEQRVLTGTLGIAGCRHCAPLSFRAVRQVSSRGGGSR